MGKDLGLAKNELISVIVKESVPPSFRDDTISFLKAINLKTQMLPDDQMGWKTTNWMVMYNEIDDLYYIAHHVDP